MPKLLQEWLENPKSFPLLGAAVWLALLAALVAAANWFRATDAAVPGGAVALILIAAALLVIAVVIADRVMSGRVARLVRYPVKPVCECDPYAIGVTPSELGDRYVVAGDTRPPYVPRDRDRDVVTKLRRERRLLLIIGPSKAGKTRTAFEAVAQRYQNHLLVYPGTLDDQGRSSLSEILDPGFFLTGIRRRWVIWLNDLVPLLEGGHLRQHQLEVFLHRNKSAIAVATISNEEYGRLVGDAAVTEDARAVLKWASHVRLEAAFSEAECADALRLYAGEPRDAVGRLPEHLVAADALVERWEEGRTTDPFSAALVHSAGHWRRAGLLEPAPLSFLVQAAQRLTPSSGRRVDLEASLAWATDPVGDAHGLLQEVEPHRYRVSDYLVQHFEQLGSRRLPDRIVDAVLQRVRESPEKLLTVGHALASRGQYEPAREALERAEEFGSEEQRGRAAAALTALSQDEHRHEDIAGVSLLRRARSEAFPGAVGSASTPPTEIQRRAADALVMRRTRLGATEGSVFDATLPQREEGPRQRAYRHPRYRTAARAALLATFDVAAVVAGVTFALGFRALLQGFTAADVLKDVLTYSPFGGPVTAVSVFVFGLYDADAPRARLTQIISALTAVSVISFVSTLLSGRGVDLAIALAAGSVLAVPLMWGARAMYDRRSRHWVRKHRLVARVLLIGHPEAVRRLAPSLLEASTRPMQLVGYLSRQRVADPDQLGDLTDLDSAIELHYIQRCVIVDIQMSAAEKVAIAERCHGAGVAVEMLPSPAEIVLGAAAGRTRGEIPLVPIDPLPLSPEAQRVKRGFDLAVALPLALVVVPAFYGVGLLLRRSVGGGRTLERSWRPGRGGRTFGMLRLHTRPEGPEHISGEAPTAMGRLVERWSIDELPQLLNVIRGEMSLVGPRPLSRVEFDRLSPEHRRRYVVWPGITGTWQVSRRRSMTGEDLLELDLLYIRHWTIFADLAILLRTPAALFSHGPWAAEPIAGDVEPSPRTVRVE